MLRTHKPQTKIETRESDIYYVLASFIEVDGRPYSLELVKRTKSDDMFERENVLNQLLVRNRQVYMDSVTKVYNRRYYEDVVRNNLGPAGIALMDIDDFKICNDTYGHHAGDLALEAVAKTIRSCIRETDLLIRYGGDEFLLLMPQSRPNGVESVIRRVQDAVQAARVPSHPELRLSVSIGGVCDVQPLTEAIRQADVRMYRNKENG